MMPRNEGAGKKLRTSSGLALGGAVQAESQHADRTDYTMRQAQGEIKTGRPCSKVVKIQSKRTGLAPIGLVLLSRYF